MDQSGAGTRRDQRRTGKIDDLKIGRGLILFILDPHEGVWYKGRVPQVLRKETHPYVTSRPGLCGGKPIIEGTKFPVRSVIMYILKLGMTPEELVQKFNHLTLAQVHDALSYYYDHQEEIEKDLKSQSYESARREFPEFA